MGWAGGGVKLMHNLTDNEYKVLENGLSPQVQVDGDQVSQLRFLLSGGLHRFLGGVGWADGGVKPKHSLTDNEYKVLENGLSPQVQVDGDQVSHFKVLVIPGAE